MTVRERVEMLIRKIWPLGYCDDCVTRLLKLSYRQQAQQATARLGRHPDFRRSVGPCLGCGKGFKIVTRAAGKQLQRRGLPRRSRQQDRAWAHTPSSTDGSHRFL